MAKEQFERSKPHVNVGDDVEIVGSKATTT